MSEIKFPTLRQRGPSSYIGEVMKVWEGINANYAGGKEGLFITVQSQNSPARDLFYPFPPSAKGNRLIKAVAEELKIDVATLGWECLEGYVFRWAVEQTPMTITDRETQERKDITVQLEFPTEVISLPEDEPGDATPDIPAADAGGSPPSAEEGEGVAVPSTNNSNADWQLFLDEVLILADGKNLGDLRLAAAESNTIRAYDRELRQRLNKGEATEELISQGRLKEEDSKFVVVLS